MQLPRWSVNTEKEIIGDYLNKPLTNGEQFSGDGVTPRTDDSTNETTSIMKSENVTNTIYKNYNGFEKTFERNSDFDKNDNFFEDGNVQSKNVTKTQSNENIRHISRYSPQLFEKDKYVRDEEVVIEDEEAPQKGDTSSKATAGSPKGGKGDETHSPNSCDKLEDSNSAWGLANLNEDQLKHDSEQKRTDTPPKGNTGVQLVLNVSNYNSDAESDGETSRVSSRHILKPVDERVTVEILRSKADDIREKTSINVGNNDPKLTDEDSRMKTVSLNLIRTVEIRPSYIKVCLKPRRVRAWTPRVLYTHKASHSCSFFMIYIDPYTLL